MSLESITDEELERAYRMLTHLQDVSVETEGTAPGWMRAGRQAVQEALEDDE